jgi:hypothetical protein
MKDEQEDSESDADFFSFHVVVLSLRLNDVVLGPFFMKNKMIIIFKNNEYGFMTLSINLFLTLQKLECKR